MQGVQREFQNTKHMTDQKLGLIEFYEQLNISQASQLGFSIEIFWIKTIFST